MCVRVRAGGGGQEACLSVAAWPLCAPTAAGFQAEHKNESYQRDLNHAKIYFYFLLRNSDVWEIFQNAFQLRLVSAGRTAQKLWDNYKMCVCEGGGWQGARGMLKCDGLAIFVHPPLLHCKLNIKARVINENRIIKRSILTFVA